MLKVTKTVPGQGIVSELEYTHYTELEPRLEVWMEKLADLGYSLSEMQGSNSRQGSIVVKRNDETIAYTYAWETVE